ncbi:MAG: hypothetical protein GY714_18085 [Desulfobacterales bacterium]|nr:hypothetical protein [Desulfobacterales bacterium]
MSGQKTKFINPDNVDPDGLAEAQAVSGAGALTLNGALIVDGTFTADYARRIGILSAGNDSGITFTIVGTDADGFAISEAVTGASAAPGTAESVLYFKTVASVTASGAAAGNVSVGTVDEIATNTFTLDNYNTDGATISVEDITGTIDFSIDETFTDFQNYQPIEFYDVVAFTTKTAATRGILMTHATGFRLRVNSYTNGADLKIVINQDRPR